MYLIPLVQFLSRSAKTTMRHFQLNDSSKIQDTIQCYFYCSMFFLVSTINYVFIFSQCYISNSYFHSVSVNISFNVIYVSLYALFILILLLYSSVSILYLSCAHCYIPIFRPLVLLSILYIHINQGISNSIFNLVSKLHLFVLVTYLT